MRTWSKDLEEDFQVDQTIIKVIPTKGKGTNINNNKQIICHYCQKVGHKRPECRKLARDKADGTYKPSNSTNKSTSVEQVTGPTEETKEDDSEEWPCGDIVQTFYDPRSRKTQVNYSILY